MRLSLRRGAMLLGAIVGLGLVAIFAVRLDWLEFRRAMLGVSWAWVAAGAFALLLSISVRAMRWLVISADKASASYPAYWSATVIGYVGNALYPGRAGEILRAASLHHAI